MKPLIIILFGLLALNFMATAQAWKRKLKITLLSADSVKILSHKTTSGIRITKRDRDEQDLVRQRKLNDNIVNMKTLLDHQAIDKVIEIFTRKNSDKVIEVIKSFTPHYGIIIYHKGIISYIDIDFQAKQIDTSSDIKIEDYLSKSSWEDLEQLFKQRRFDF